jgi:DNA-binding NarL/FixJ family response regulator
MTARVTQNPNGRLLPQLSVVLLARNQRKRGYMASLLESEGFRVAGGHASMPKGAFIEGDEEPDALVLVVDEALANQAATIHHARERFPGASILVVTPSATGRGMREALGAGADGIVWDAHVEFCLGIALRAACSGQLSIPRELRDHLAKPILTSREKQILGMVVMGFSNQEIAKKLYLAESTVKSHLSSAFGKLGVRSRNDATALILDSDSGLGTGILAISQDDAAPVGRQR